MTPAGLAAARRCERLVREGSARCHRLDLAGAEPLLREALAEAERSGRERAVATASQHLYFLLRRQHRDAEAAEALERNVEAHRRLCGVDGRWTAEWRNELIGLYGHVGANGHLEALCQERLASDRRRHGERSPEVAWSLLTLAWALRSGGRWGESERLCREALGLLEEAFGCDHPRTGWALTGLALARRCQGDPAGAERSLRRARANWDRVGHVDRVAAVDELLIDLLAAHGRCQEALDLSSARCRACGPAADERRLRFAERRAAILRALGRDAEAAAGEAEARDLRRAIERRCRRDRADEEAPVACAGAERITGPVLPSPLL